MTDEEWREEMERMDNAIDREHAFDERVQEAMALADELSCDAIDSKPQDADWQEAFGEDMEGLVTYEADECGECSRDVILTSLGEHQHRDVEHELTVDTLPSNGDEFKCPECDNEFTVVCGEAELDLLECPECETEIYEGDTFPNTCCGYLNSDGPMMNYWYPVQIDDGVQAAKLISHLPLCVVEFRDGRTGLALTGGGMDLSPAICQAFIALGYLPPVHFGSLPRFAGFENYKSWVELIVCCQRSAEVQRRWGEGKLETLDDMLAAMRKAVGDGPKK